MTYDIHAFVRDALAKGKSKDEVRAALKEARWVDEQIDAALGAYSDVRLEGLVVPKPAPYHSPAEAAKYFFMFAMLYVSAVNFGTLLFEYINRWVPDPLNQYYGGGDVRFPVAALVISFPFYFWFQSRTQRALAQEPAKRNSKIRKWLTWFTVLIASFVLIGDAIALVFNLLGGELTLRFVLKVLVIMVIAGLIFGYYKWDLSQDEKAV